MSVFGLFPIIGSPYLSSVSSICRKARQCPHLRLNAKVVRSATDEVELKVLTCVTTSYNNIVILDTPDSRVLLLDSSNNVHSILHKDKKWTGAYWDEFASLPAIVPSGGPIAIFGLGGATAAHLMLELWPCLKLVGWEIDQILIEKARQYLGLSDLEKVNKSGGVLEVEIGDVFSPCVSVPEGGYAGIIVDLFCDGKVLPQLEELQTWLEMSKKLMPNGRIMVNCGAATKEWSNSETEPWQVNATINALRKAGELSWKKLPKSAGENYVAMTGALPDLDTWSASLPPQLNLNVREWRSCT